MLHLRDSISLVLKEIEKYLPSSDSELVRKRRNLKVEHMLQFSTNTWRKPV